MSISTLTLIVNGIYMSCLGLALVFHYGVRGLTPVEPARTQTLAIILFAVGVLDYLISLWIEARRLRPQTIQARIRTGRSKSVEGAVASAGIIRAALGVAPATYALIFSLLGLQPAFWFWLMLATTALAYLHQRLGWDRYQQAVRNASESV